MNEATSELIKGLKKAIQTEADGHHFYTIAADRMKDPKGKEAFRILADEEVRHLEFLQGQYRSLRDTGALDDALSLGKRHDFSTGPIFSDEIVRHINEAQFEMSALSIGIQLELASMNYYREQAEKASDPDVGRFYNELADWETGHYNALLRQQEMLKEDFWAKGGFAPF